MKVLQNGRLLRFSKRTDCWFVFSWSIYNQIALFIRCIQSSSVQGYDNIHIMGGHHQLRGVSGRKPKLSEWDCCTLKRIMSVNHRSTAAGVTAELHIHLEDRFHRNSLTGFTNGRAAITKPLITDNSTKRWKRWCDDHKTWPSDDWKYII